MRGKLLSKLADLVEANAEEFAALETLDVGEYESLCDEVYSTITDNY
jgi:acyl-CoA reductase-like NAD-dependent aldehyde dehydrogenase